MIIGAWDIGRSTGIAVGRADRAPMLSTVKMPDPEPLQRGALDFSRAIDCFMKWAEEWLTVHRPGRLFIECPFAADRRGGVHLAADIRNQFAYAGIADGMCRRLGVGQGSGRADEVSVTDVREHFIGQRVLKAEQADRLTITQCKAFGWSPKNGHEADAAALFHFAVVDQLDLPTPFVLPHHREAA